MSADNAGDLATAAALVRWAILTRGWMIAPGLHLLQGCLFTSLYDMFKLLLAKAFELGVEKALLNFFGPPTPDQGKAELGPSSTQEMWIELATLGAQAVQQWICLESHP